MDTIVNMWWLRLFIPGVVCGIVLVYQLSHLRYAMKIDKTIPPLLDYLGTMIVLGWLGTASLIILGISIVVNVIEYIR